MQLLEIPESRKEAVARALVELTDFIATFKEFIGKPGSSGFLDFMGAVIDGDVANSKQTQFEKPTRCGRATSFEKGAEYLPEIVRRVSKAHLVILDNTIRYMDDKHHDTRQDLRDLLFELMSMLTKVRRIASITRWDPDYFGSEPDFFSSLFKKLNLAIAFFRVSEELHKSDCTFRKAEALKESSIALVLLLCQLKTFLKANEDGSVTLSRERIQGMVHTLNAMVALYNGYLWCDETSGPEGDVAGGMRNIMGYVQSVLEKEQLLENEVQEIFELAKNLEKAIGKIRISESPQPTTTNFGSCADVSIGNGIG